MRRLAMEHEVNIRDIGGAHNDGVLGLVLERLLLRFGLLGSTLAGAEFGFGELWCGTGGTGARGESGCVVVVVSLIVVIVAVDVDVFEIEWLEVTWVTAIGGTISDVDVSLA